MPEIHRKSRAYLHVRQPGNHPRPAGVQQCMGDDGPFLGSEALAAGVLNRYQLSTHYERVFRDVYIPRGYPMTAATKAHAAWLSSHRRAVVAGVSAAAVHGSRWVDTRLPAELIQPSRFRAPGLLLHSDTLQKGETCTVARMPVTTPARTAFDLGRRKGLTTAVIRVDALMNATGLKADEVAAVAERHAGARGVVQLRAAIELADGGAESPQETRTRLVLTAAGLRPETQIEVYDDYGVFVARLDMGWRRWKVAVEYDGAQHWTDPTQRTRDIDRWAMLEALGSRIIRVSYDMLSRRPATIVERATSALRAAGWAPT